MTIVATNKVLIDAADEHKAAQMALELYGHQERFLDNADYEVSNIIPDPYNEENDQ